MRLFAIGNVSSLVLSAKNLILIRLHSLNSEFCILIFIIGLLQIGIYARALIKKLYYYLTEFLVQWLISTLPTKLLGRCMPFKVRILMKLFISLGDERSWSSDENNSNRWWWPMGVRCWERNYSIGGCKLYFFMSKRLLSWNSTQFLVRSASWQQTYAHLQSSKLWLKCNHQCQTWFPNLHPLDYSYMQIRKCHHMRATLDNATTLPEYWTFLFVPCAMRFEHTQNSHWPWWHAKYLLQSGNISANVTLNQPIPPLLPFLISFRTRCDLAISRKGLCTSKLVITTWQGESTKLANLLPWSTSSPLLLWPLHLTTSLLLPNHHRRFGDIKLDKR